MASPPVQKACTPRVTRDCAASRMSLDCSIGASNKVIPNSVEMSRACFVQNSELTSAGFHTTPTVLRLGLSCLATRKISVTGCGVPTPVK